jgi:hypothetical protein
MQKEGVFLKPLYTLPAKKRQKPCASMVIEIGEGGRGERERERERERKRERKRRKLHIFNCTQTRFKD